MNMFGFVCLQEDALKKCGFDGDSGNTPTPGECAGQQPNSPNNACQTCIEAACTAADSSGCALNDPAYAAAFASCLVEQ
jgi:hypothetical protein